MALAANVGGDGHNLSRRVTPLAPKNGFYDQRHVCKTLTADKLQFKNPFPRIFKGPPHALKELTQKYAEWEEQASEKATPAESAAKEPEPDA